MMQSKKIAVTGGIGSGKSAFCNILREKGYPVYSCDEINRELWENGEYVAGLLRLFPGCKTKRDVAAQAFQNEGALARLNGYSHPRIMRELLRRMEGELCFAEVPLLFEGGYEDLFDGVVALVRGTAARVGAVHSRDSLSESEIKARMRAQIDADVLRKKHCIIVENDADLASLERKAEEVLQMLGVGS